MADFDGGLLDHEPLGSGSPVLVVQGQSIGPAGNVEPPVVSGVEPTPGTEIESLQVLEFDVTDDGPIAAVFVSVLFPTGAHEVVWDSEAFAARYAQGSAVSDAAGGLHFAVRRAGGWRSERVTLRIQAVDSSGNLVSEEVSFP